MNDIHQAAKEKNGCGEGNMKVITQDKAFYRQSSFVAKRGNVKKGPHIKIFPDFPS